MTASSEPYHEETRENPIERVIPAIKYDVTIDVQAVLHAIFYLLREKLPMAAVATRVSDVGPGLPLTPRLEERSRMDLPSKSDLRAH